MSIDWITVAAQLLNFAVLVWLLKRFLYRPILDGIEARERDIAERIAAADAAKAEADADAARHRAALDAVASEKAALLESARQEAEALAEERRAAAEQAEAAELAAWRQAAAERARYADALGADGAEALLALAGKALRDLADDDLEARIAGRFVDRIAEAADALRAAGGRAGQAAITTRGTLPASVQTRLEAAFREHVADAPISFDTNADQAPGVVLQFGAARIEWTLESYLKELSGMLAERLDRRPSSDVTP